MDIEKQQSASATTTSKLLHFIIRSIPAIILLGFIAITGSGVLLNKDQDYFPLSSKNCGSRPLCPIIPYVRPDSYHSDNSTVLKIISDELFRNLSAKKLSGAVRIKTDVYDDSPLVKEDPKYWDDKFKPFYEYLESTFPNLFEFAEVERINGWALVFTWKGSNHSLKPILLTAHQDVVPTQDATLKDWTYPPYEGVYDGEHLWGRGSADCKNLLIGVIEALEELHANGFKPNRTIVLGFGIDEEIGGERGASKIGEKLLEKYGKSSFYAVIDEGGQSLIEQEGIFLALPGTGEKGIVNVVIGLNTPGGHSSVPPDHTSIGILSKLISSIEDEPFHAIFSPRNPTFHEYQCIATHSPSLLPAVRTAILNAEANPLANEVAIEYLTHQSLATRYLIETTQAVDLIHGGAKLNALPEYTEAVINHRISVESSVNETVSKDLRHVLKIAKRFNLGVLYEDTELLPKTDAGYFTVHKEGSLEPAPLTPVNDKHWDILGGVIRHVYEEVAYPSKFDDKPVVVAPGIATGNTDTHWYWPLTEHIYRYRPGLTPTVETHAHGVDEHIPFDSHLQIIAFYYQYLQVIDSLED